MGHQRRNTWSSLFLRVTPVRCIRGLRAFLLMLGTHVVKILTDVVPKLELVESWTEDELITVLHEASRDLDVAPKAFMTVLRHALSGMRVCGTTYRSSRNAHHPDRLDPG